MNDHISSTDDIRSDAPLRHLQTVTFPGPIALELGESLEKIACAYETWGQLNENASNAVLVCHALSGDSHAARHDDGDAAGWWDDLIGPGKPIDTNRFFVVCPNVLGGCRGSTGPGDLRPSVNGEAPSPYGAEFPQITIGDIVDVQKRLAEHLGISKWRAVVGGSLGGHQSLAWAHRHPKSLETCVAIATSARLTAQAMGFDVIARNAIQTDPNFAGGQYYDRAERPDTGLAIARMLGHITYLSHKAMEQKFDGNRHDPRQIASIFEQQFSVGSYLAHQGQKFTSRFDANSYLTLSMAMSLFDLGANRDSLMESLQEAECNFLALSFSSDWLFPPQQSTDIVQALIALNKSVTYAEIPTEAGHDAFLIGNDIAQYGPLITAQLNREPEPPQRSSIATPPVSHDTTLLSGPSGPPELDFLSQASAPSLVEEVILRLIPMDASVLDLGCGDGRLLDRLRARGHQRLAGVEVSLAEIRAAAQRGLDVVAFDLNEGLPLFVNGQFDVVVVNQTLQAVANVEALFAEMLRVGEHAIVSFANFAHRSLREDYAERGRSPQAPGAYSYDWYNTPNRRFPSIMDVEKFCQSQDVKIHRAVYLDQQQGALVDSKKDPNLFADTAVLLLGTPCNARDQAT